MATAAGGAGVGFSIPFNLNQTPVSGTGTTGGSSTGAFFSRADDIPRASDINFTGNLGASKEAILIGLGFVMVLGAIALRMK